MNKIVFVFLAFCLLWQAVSADTLSLSQCYYEAQKINPVNEEKGIQELLHLLKKENLSSGWFPDISLNAQILYASEVTDFSGLTKKIPIPGLSFPEVPHDQYKATLDIQQTLFDGLASMRSKQVEETMLQQNIQAIAVEQYSLYETINQLYFALLLSERNLSLANLFKTQLESRLTELNAGVINGIVLEENYFILQAEIIKANQQISDLTIQFNTTCALLSFYTGLSISKSPTLLVPDVTIKHDVTIDRPEKKLFELSKKTIDANNKLLSSTRLPKAFSFFSGGYGNPPGGNIMRDEFDFYYSVGLGIKWNIFDWNTTRRNKTMLEQQKKLLSIKEELFDRSIHTALERQYIEIEQLEKVLLSDKELITLREKITETMNVKLTMGTINSTEYLTELNAEKQAKINLELHSLQLVKAKIGYVTLSGAIVTLQL